ncbi:hypothetical protein ACJMK2_006621 [Sinanodonta woodiana]|uniref:Uncharacterized protein n=1 Tax=Sinanodonta woodiana TaxID=1069815 RepID=A0ABD3VWY2_SINWO
MRSGSYDIIIVLLFTTVTIATAATYTYGKGSKYNSQSINGGNLRNMMNLNNIPGMMKNARILTLMRTSLGTGGMSDENFNWFSQGSTINVNGLDSVFSGVQNAYRIRAVSVNSGNNIGLDINRVQNRNGIRMGSQHGIMNNMAGKMSGGPQGTSFSNSYFPRGKPNNMPIAFGGGGFSLIHNRFRSGVGFDNGRRTKMTEAMLGRPQGSSFGTSYLPSIHGSHIFPTNGRGGDIHRIGNGHVNELGSGYGNINKVASGTPSGAQLSLLDFSFNENPLPTVNGIAAAIHPIGHGHVNGMGSGYGNINTMAGGMLGGAQLNPFGMSFVSSGNTNGLSGVIESAGSGATFRNNVGDNGDNMAMHEETRVGGFSSGNQEIGDMVSNDFSSNGNGNPWETNSVVPDNVDQFDDSEDLGSDNANDFDDIFDQLIE